VALFYAGIWSKNPKGRDYSKDLGVDGKTIRMEKCKGKFSPVP